jgi:hypothetical protein
MGGHGAEPYEQKTQQSPALGRSTTWHPPHSWKNRQASVGIASGSACPQAGQVRTEVVVTAVGMRERYTRHAGRAAPAAIAVTPAPPRQGMASP